MLFDAPWGPIFTLHILTNMFLIWKLQWRERLLVNNDRIFISWWTVPLRKSTKMTVQLISNRCFILLGCLSLFGWCLEALELKRDLFFYKVNAVLRLCPAQQKATDWTCWYTHTPLIHTHTHTSNPTCIQS